MAYGKTGGHETAETRSHQDEVATSLTQGFQCTEPCCRITLKVWNTYLREMFRKPLSVGPSTGRIQAVKKEYFAHGVNKVLQQPPYLLEKSMVLSFRGVLVQFSLQGSSMDTKFFCGTANIVITV